MKFTQNIHTFIACDKDYETSKIALFGAPFDSTVSNKPGSRFASSAIRDESFYIETYSPYQDRDLNDINVFDCGDLELPFGNPQRALSMIEEHTKLLLNDDKIPFMIGGEHLVTLGSFLAVANKFSRINILHFDAHADLREDYLGEKLSHATVMRRCWENLNSGKLYQFGIRSGTREEFSFVHANAAFNPYNLNGIERAIKEINDAPVYLTIDLDVIDPSEFPGTGTPEAGGISFRDFLDGIYKLRNLNIKGVDIVELSPPCDHSGISTALACKAIREIMLMIG